MGIGTCNDHCFQEAAKAKIVRIVALAALVSVVFIVAITLGCFFALRFFR